MMYNALKLISFSRFACCYDLIDVDFTDHLIYIYM